VPVSHVLDPIRSAALPDGACQIPGLLDVLAQVPDPRARRGIRHQMTCLLATAALAVLSGAKTFTEIGDHAADLPQDVLAGLGARYDRVTAMFVAASEPTLRRAIQATDADIANTLLSGWVRARLAEGFDPDSGDSPGLALDGKKVHGAAISLVSAVTHTAGIVVAQRLVPDHTTETTQVKALLEPLDVHGWVITADAAHTQRTTATHLVDVKKADYLLPVKRNQPKLADNVAALLTGISTTEPAHVDTERSHGRITRRTLWITTADGIDFPHAAQVLRIRRDVYGLDGIALSKQNIHAITSLTPARATPARIATLARRHWTIESVHWIRDVTWGEDANTGYTGNGAHLLAALRNLALNLLRLNGITKIKRTLQRLNRRPAQAFALLTA
jgi:predicted transposase YbfD/YdcC